MLANILLLMQNGANAAQSADGASAGSQWSFWIMMILIFVVFYFFMIRPQTKKQKEVNEFRKALKKGDKVLTVGGIYGTIAEVKETTVLLDVSNGVLIKVDKSGLVKDPSDVAAQTK